jgi:hypothetical protein
MAQRGGRKKSSLIEDNFKPVIAIGLKHGQHQCIHCDHQSTRNAVRGERHLDQCVPYQKELAKRVTSSNRMMQLPITTLIRPLNQAQVALTHRTAAMSIYMTNLPFNHFENPYVIAHHQALNPNYKPPHHKLVAERLLNEIYEMVKSKMYKKLNACNYLNVFTDETTNIRKKRVINLCCHVPPSTSSNEGGFQLKASVKVTEKMTAIVQAE